MQFMVGVDQTANRGIVTTSKSLPVLLGLPPGDMAGRTLREHGASPA